MTAPGVLIKNVALLWILALVGCATQYQPQGLTGGYSDLLRAPDEAVIAFHGNGFTSAERAGEMAALRCAEVTLQHGYRYFVLLSAPAFIEFLESKLQQHSPKVIPADDVIEAQARRIWEGLQAERRCKVILENIHAQTATAQLLTDLVEQVEAILQEAPALSWDQATAKVMASLLATSAEGF